MITKLKIAIDKSGYKQTHLAKMLGVPYASLSKYVCGELIPSKPLTEKIAKILHTSISNIIENT